MNPFHNGNHPGYCNSWCLSLWGLSSLILPKPMVRYACFYREYLWRAPTRYQLERKACMIENTNNSPQKTLWNVSQSPTKKVSLQSPWWPPMKTVTSMFTMSPSSKGLVCDKGRGGFSGVLAKRRGHLKSGIPWHTTLFTEVHTDFGKPL